MRTSPAAFVRVAALLLVALALLSGRPACAQPDETPGDDRPDPRLERELDQLIQQLEGFDDLLRERARRRLIELGADALPRLRARLKAGGPRARDYRELIERVEARAAIDAADRANAARRAGERAEADVMRQHWDAFVARYLTRKLEQAEDLGRRGNHSEALALLDALTRLEPGMPAALRQKVDKLRRALKSQRFRETAVAGEIAVPRSVFRWGESIRLTFELVNKGDADFLVRASQGDRTSSIAVRVLIQDYNLYGEATDVERTANVSLGEGEIRLSRGQRWRKGWTVDLPPRPAGGVIYREVRVLSRAIPLGMEARGKLLDQLHVDFPEQRFRVFPAGYEQHASKPLVSMRGALRTRQAEALFIAGLLVPRHRHKQAIELLIDGLGSRRGAVRDTSIGLLERLTGQSRNRFRRVDTWVLWWKAHRERFQPRDDLGQ